MADEILGSGGATDLVALTVDLLAAYVSNNTVPSADLPGLVASVHGAMTQLGQPRPTPAEAHTPAVSVKKSITPDALISLIDGKPYKTLKRHLSGHGLTPAQYRALRASGQLPDVGGELLRTALGDGQADRPWRRTQERVGAAGRCRGRENRSQCLTEAPRLNAQGGCQCDRGQGQAERGKSEAPHPER